eukprot:TRINITY_DN7800_c0_g1_i2.p1 TRINITY_DN7800_c0_g1~~TRINITY_DN7800_c0_g1_i2.p1  ORF type:complete len:413 (-),score=64.11 TRINITY_DN7800_c0_g1_i2:1208-2395(-)
MLLLDVIKGTWRDYYEEKSISVEQILSVWNEIMNFVQQNMLIQRSVNYPGLGLFTIRKPQNSGRFKGTVKPDFILSSGFCRQFNIRKGTKVPPDHITQMQINFASIAMICGVSRDDASQIFRNIIKTIGNRLGNGNVELDCTFGKLYISKSGYELRFNSDFTSALQGEGALNESLKAPFIDSEEIDQLEHEVDTIDLRPSSALNSQVLMSRPNTAKQNFRPSSQTQPQSVFFGSTVGSSMRNSWDGSIREHKLHENTVKRAMDYRGRDHDYYEPQHWIEMERMRKEQLLFIDVQKAKTLENPVVGEDFDRESYVQRLNNKHKNDEIERATLLKERRKKIDEYNCSHMRNGKWVECEVSIVRDKAASIGSHEGGIFYSRQEPIPIRQRASQNAGKC